MSRASFFPARNKKGELKSLYGAEEARLGTVCHAVFAFRNLAQERSRATAQLAPVRTYTVDETIKWAAYEPKAVDDVVRIGEKKAIEHLPGYSPLSQAFALEC